MINLIFTIIAFIIGFFLGATAIALAAQSGRMSAQEEGFEWGYEAGQKELRDGKCHWKYDADYNEWNTGCGQAFVFFDAGPKKEQMKYCPYCGYEIEAEEIKNEAY